MTRSTLLLFMGYTSLSVCGLLLLKSSGGPAAQALRDGVPAWPVLLAVTGAACYAAGFGLWLVILARVPLTRAYPIAVGLTLVGTTVAAVLLLRERVGPRELAGTSAVFVGVWLLARD